MSNQRSFYRYTETPLYIGAVGTSYHSRANAADYPDYPVSANANDYIYSTSAGLQVSASVPPMRTLGQSQLHRYFPDAPLTASLNTDFYLNGNSDQIIGKTGEADELYGRLAGFNFGQTYLNSFNLTLEPYRPASISADFSIYKMTSDRDGSSTASVNDDYRSISTTNPDELEGGTFAPNIPPPEPNITITPLNTQNHVTTELVGYNRNTIGVEHPISISWSESYERLPIYVVGKKHPVEVNLGNINREVTVQGEDIGKVIDFKGHDKRSATITILLRAIGSENQPGQQISRVLSIAGQIDTQEVSISQNGFMEGTVTIKESVR